MLGFERQTMTRSEKIAARRFQLCQLLRRGRGGLTASQLATRLGCSSSVARSDARALEAAGLVQVQRTWTPVCWTHVDSVQRKRAWCPEPGSRTVRRRTNQAICTLRILRSGLTDVHYLQDRSTHQTSARTGKTAFFFNRRWSVSVQRSALLVRGIRRPGLERGEGVEGQAQP